MQDILSNPQVEEEFSIYNNALQQFEIIRTFKVIF